MPHREWTKDGRKAPSVTEVKDQYVDPELVRWRGSVGNAEADRRMREAGEFGTEVHALIEECFARQAPVGQEDKQGILADQAWAWWVEEGGEVISQEGGIFCEEDGFGGTSDLIGRLKRLGKRLVVFDWKTSSKFSKMFRAQLAAYAKSYNEKHGLSWETGVNYGIIVLLNKKDVTKPPKIYEFDNLKRDYEVFKGLKTLWDFLHAEGLWREDVAKPSSKPRRRKAA